MTAAVADYRPEARLTGKIRKEDSSTLSLKLVANPDILLELARIKSHQVIIGFALEVSDSEANARRKMARKGMDAVVVNSPTTFARDDITARVIVRDGRSFAFHAVTKDVFARELVKLAEGLASGNCPAPDDK